MPHIFTCHSCGAQVDNVYNQARLGKHCCETCHERDRDMKRLQEKAQAAYLKHSKSYMPTDNLEPCVDCGSKEVLDTIGRMCVRCHNIFVNKEGQKKALRDYAEVVDAIPWEKIINDKPKDEKTMHIRVGEQLWVKWESGWGYASNYSEYNQPATPEQMSRLTGLLAQHFPAKYRDAIYWEERFRSLQESVTRKINDEKQRSFKWYEKSLSLEKQLAEIEEFFKSETERYNRHMDAWARDYEILIKKKDEDYAEIADIRSVEWRGPKPSRIAWLWNFLFTFIWTVLCWAALDHAKARHWIHLPWWH